MVTLKPGERISTTLDSIQVKTADAVNLKYVRYKESVCCALTNMSLILFKYEGIISKKQRVIDNIPFEQIYEQSLDFLNYREVVLKWRDKNGREFQSTLSGDLKALIDHLGSHFNGSGSERKHPDNMYQSIKEIERVREIVKIKCQYCGNLYEENISVCPNCGGR